MYHYKYVLYLYAIFWNIIGFLRIIFSWVEGLGAAWKISRESTVTKGLREFFLPSPSSLLEKKMKNLRRKNVLILSLLNTYLKANNQIRSIYLR